MGFNEARRDKRKQRGIEDPKAYMQPNLLIIRLDLMASSGKDKQALRGSVQEGLKRLCSLFERLDTGKKRIDEFNDQRILTRVPLSKFNFSATIGFGIGFFDKLDIPEILRPRRLKSMPNHLGLGDIEEYSLPQTDLIIQLASNSDFVNQWVLENAYEPPEYRRSANNKIANAPKEEQDIVSAISKWAIITDMHSGFQRKDGRNLMGFNDGISNPKPGSGDGFNNIVWTTEKDEGQILNGGTYMVFQKIEHDLDQWKELSIDEQEKWVGRNKVTGLLLGTPENDDKKFIEAIKNDDQRAKDKLRKLLEGQSDPEKWLYDSAIFKKNVPAWSHVRKANPRQERYLYGKRIEKRIIFRRGYLFLETGLNNRRISGLLFICFQRDIENSFEHIKKNWLSNKKFPTPSIRPFTSHELSKRRSQGRFSLEQMEKIARLDLSIKRLLGLDDYDLLRDKIKETQDPDTQSTGREGLASPSELGTTPTGDFLAVVPFGGGYYFIPPVPSGNIADIGQQFFNRT
jgi:Dyp-type peroxidase family